MPTQADDILDLTTATLKELGRNKMTDLTGDLTEYVAATKILEKERAGLGQGYGKQFNVMKDDNGQATRTGLYAVENFNRKDVLTTGYAPFRHYYSNYVIDEREVKMNGGIARIVDVLLTQRLGGQISLVKLLESDFWDKPVDSTDNEKIFGIAYWIVPNASAGFNGGNPTGFAAGAGGISSTAVTRWANYTDQYTNVTKDDLIFKTRVASRRCGFTSPVNFPDYAKGTRYAYYCNLDTITSLETQVEQQNENLMDDLASKDGKAMFRRNPIVYAPALDDGQRSALLPTDPFYGVDWGEMWAFYLNGEWMNETEPYKLPNQRRSVGVGIYLSFNICCTNRRKQFVIQHS